MIGIIAKLKTKPGQADAFRNQVARMSKTVETNEPGNVFYRGYLTDDENRFVALEVYQDEAAIEAHRASEHVAASLPEVMPMLDGDLDVETVTQVW